MTTTIGHWDNMTAVQKLVQNDLLLAGIIDTIIKEGEILPRLPVRQIDAKNLIYYREKEVPDILAYKNSGDILDWSAGMDYGTKQSIELVIAAGQRRIDNFPSEVYKNPSDVYAQAIKEITKGVTQFIETEVIYGTGTGGHAQGMAKIIADIQTLSSAGTEGDGYDDYSTTLNINMGDAGLSLGKLRTLIDSIRPGKPDIILMNRTYARKFDAMIQEAPLTISSTVTAFPQGIISWTKDDLGGRVTLFDGIPIVRSDYISDNENATGGLTTGTGATSVFAIKFGDIPDGGFCAVFGGQGGDMGKIFKVEPFDKLENYDSKGIRVIGYFNFALGSIKQLGRIYNIDMDGAITA